MKISIITVTFNSAATVADTLASVERQTHRDIEYIVIDGGSTDQTLSIVGSGIRRVDTLVSEADAGIYDAMNKGIGVASGDVIGFINSDDTYAAPNIIEAVSGAFEDSALDGCYGDLCYVRKDDVRRVVRYWRSSPFQPGMFMRGWCPPHPTLFLRRSVYERYGRFKLEHKVVADFELMARLFEVHRIRTRYLPLTMVNMRLGGVSNRSLRGTLRQNLEILGIFDRLGLRSSAFSFAVNKLASRGKQFFIRPE